MRPAFLSMVKDVFLASIGKIIVSGKLRYIKLVQKPPHVNEQPIAVHIVPHVLPQLCNIKNGHRGESGCIAEFYQ